MNNKILQKKNILVIYANDVTSYAMELKSLFIDHVCHVCPVSKGKLNENLVTKSKRDFIIVLLSNEILLQCNIERIHGLYSDLEKEAGEIQKFCPYIIQKSLSTWTEWPQWIENTPNFVSRFFRSPYMILKDLEEKYRRKIWNKNPLIRVMESTFVGRSREIEAFQNKYYSNRGYYYKVLVVSGREGVGKDVFARYCLNQMGFPSEYEPYSINLNRNSSIENFILQLNSIERLFSMSDLKEKLAGSTAIKVDVAVDLLNEVYDAKDVLFVEDSGACILPQREPTQWLKDIITNPRLKFALGLFVKSRFIPRPNIENEHPNIAHINLGPLSTSDRKKLFYLFCRSYIPDIRITEEEANYFVDKLYYSSNQLIAVAFEISRSHGDVEYVKEHLDSIISMGDKMARPILRLYDNKKDYEKEEYLNLLYILSKFEYVSFDILKKIMGERYKESLQMIFDLIVYGVVELFGQSEEFIRLDHYMSDYINRNRLKMSQAWSSSFNETMTEIIERENVNATEDVSLYLYEIRQQLEKNYNKSIPENYLIPSIVLKVIIDKYNEKHYDDVIELCEKTLDDGYHYYEDIRQELRYWQCAAFCHNRDAKGFEEKIQDIKELALKKYLLGLYARCKGSFSEGEKNLKEAIQRAPGMGKAKRELVMCLMGQNKYSEALPIARENYEQQSENIYYIQTYFRCLARKQGLTPEDVKILSELMLLGEQLVSRNEHKCILEAMNIDHKVYIEQAPPSQVISYIQQKEKEYPSSRLIKRISDDYRLKMNMISTTNNIEEEWSNE